jgi:hypothetical protein
MIDGWHPDSLEIFVLLWSGAAALNELAGVNHKAFVILNREVNRGRIEWSTPIHDGVADELGIDVGEAKRLYAAGVSYIFHEVGTDEPLAEEWWVILEKL